MSLVLSIQLSSVDCRVVSSNNSNFVFSCPADIDECQVLDKPCGSRAICENTSPGYNCLCPQGYTGRPEAKVACEQVRRILDRKAQMGAD